MHVKLAHHMTRRERHLWDCCGFDQRPLTSHSHFNASLTRRVPRAKNDPSIGGVASNLVDALLELVDTLPLIIGIAINVRRAKMAPLEPIHGPEIALAAVSQPAGLEERLGGVPVPDLDAALREELRVCFTADEPQEFLDDAFEVGAFGGEEGEGGVGEGEAEGGGREDGVCAGAGAVVARFTIGDDALDEGEVLLFFVHEGGGGGWEERRTRHDAVIIWTRVSRDTRDPCHVTPGIRRN